MLIGHHQLQAVYNYNLRMWNQKGLTVIHNATKLVHGFCRRCCKEKFVSGVDESHRYHRRSFFISCNIQSCCVSNPPWRVLFFGSDDFAVESLKRLHASRGDGADSVVDSLEVVTLSNNVPVRKFAEQQKLRVHEWPEVQARGRFDVGVVVSFGCLLQESLINTFPYGILNVHPSLLPRWRGPAPVFHTILHGDKVTGVTIMQIRPRRFDVGPILSQKLYEVPENSTADELGGSLAVLGAQLLIDTLRNLPERIADGTEQAREGATFAPKINSSLSWLVWEDQTCDEIDRLYRAIGSRVHLRTIWMGRAIKLLDFVGKCNVPLAEISNFSAIPGSIYYQKESNTLSVCCKDGWVGFKTVMLKKRLSAADFFNGYLHQSVFKKSQSQNGCHFQSYREKNQQNSTSLLRNKTCR
ncbi:LOW QUALITY PROTEIN: methionyl-tRNA formyltransferase, mitochondrial [Tachysurus fulvidraco]|uniref:LOW QUALITY PROTEIN: methionyl-tRNA formyltransferase, mitochondrial n=1 Tax=Tachysurus fulvidraco TaxID=1234273 RepID=UPI001FED3405|nr:LOW QUALITY PROTEIN: methionyl-tRNA formyltransferase, mitochondrial [Tachysurus fulvidraco]